MKYETIVDTGSVSLNDFESSFNKRIQLSQKVPALGLVSTLFTFLPLWPHPDKALKAKHKHQIKKKSIDQ